MSRSIQEALGLEVDENLFRKDGEIVEDDEEFDLGDDELESTSTQIALMTEFKLSPETKEDLDKLDTIHKDTLKHAEELLDLGFNSDIKSAGKIFDNSANFYKISLDAVNSKQDIILKTQRLSIEQKKMEIAARIKSGQIKPVGNDVGDKDLVLEDRNELLAKLTAEAEAITEPDHE